MWQDGVVDEVLVNITVGVRIDHPAVVVGAFKPAHDIQNAVVLRLYESHGGGASAKVTLGFPVSKVELCNGLEKSEGEEIPVEGNAFQVSFLPFKIRSFLITLGN